MSCGDSPEPRLCGDQLSSSWRQAGSQELEHRLLSRRGCGEACPKRTLKMRSLLSLNSHSNTQLGT